MRYEIGIAIEIPKLVWANAPFPCGTYSDLRIFRERLKLKLQMDEFVLCDRGYTDEKCIQPQGDQHRNDRTLLIIRALHEIFNKRMKQFNVLKNRFRHDLGFHVYCFYAVLHVTHLMMDEEPLFTTNY